MSADGEECPLKEPDPALCPYCKYPVFWGWKGQEEVCGWCRKPREWIEAVYGSKEQDEPA
jgi:hypothetical protein